MIAGIDEAGRGSVLGPLSIALVCGEEEDFLSLELADSKLLTRSEREALFPEIRKKFYTSFVLVTAKELNEMMKRFSLNEIEAIKEAYLLDELPLEPHEVIVDSPDVLEQNFAHRIARHMARKLTIRAEHKADLNYPVVSAASIVAKVIRDWEIDRIRDEVGYDFQSGYPSDEKTVAAVREMLRTGKGKEYVRMRWSTVESIIASQQKLHDYF
ncbi:MAG: ribonuclease HII [Candidatus Micrarchaeota archaeon]|nr:ribonuclease HII [Candidatus Micrarchaeota archaeon]